MTKKYLVLQDGIKECGSACLLSIIRYYGGNISLERLLELTKTTKDGTNFYNLSLAAKEIGLTAKGYKIDDVNELLNIDSPFISQVVINNYKHFIVVYKIKNNKITIMDPAKGMLKIDIDKFLTIWTSYILLITPYKKLPVYEDNNYIINIIKCIITDNKKIIINLISLTLIVTIFTCIYSYYFKIIIDNVLSTNKFNLLVIAIIFIMILSIKVVIEYLRNNLLLYLNQKLDLSIITTTINKIIFLPYSYYKNKTTGEIIARVNDLMYIKNVISKIIISIFLDSVLALVTIIILFNINSIMTVVLILIIIFYTLIFYCYKKSINNMTNLVQENNSKISSFLVESISSYETIKGLNLETKFRNKINKLYLESINNNLKFSKMLYSQELLKDLFEGIAISIIIYIGTTYIMDKSLSIGMLITYNSLLYYFINPIRSSFEFYKDYFYVKNSANRINNILNFKYEELDHSSNLKIDGAINFSHLNFSYNKRYEILKDLNLTIDKGEKVIILGSSGSGKSTLLKLLYKYYEVKRGCISVNGYDINDFTLKDIRKNITYISQNEILYTDTIRNNILLDREITDNEFLHACKITHVEDILKNNLLSYDYPLEENGSNISGGQRQRIILARSLLKNSNIILIDEGLNEIDMNLERQILKNIFNEYIKKTIIIISHRQSNIDLYDKIVKMDNGQVKEVSVRNE